MPSVSTETQTADSLRMIAAEVRRLSERIEADALTMDEAGTGPLKVKHFASLGLGLSKLETFVAGIGSAIRDHRLMRGDFSGKAEPPNDRKKGR